MKKRIVLFLSLIIVALLAFYILIPGRIQISVAEKIQCPADAVVRLLQDSSNWKKWLPGSAANPGSSAYEEMTFRGGKPLLTGVESIITVKNIDITGTINVVPVNTDSSVVEWRAAFEPGFNPISRISYWIHSGRLADKTALALSGLRQFAEKQENVYGITIRKVKVTDTLLITSRFTSDSLPSTKAIYQAIHKLEQYANAHQASVVHPPMLNTKKTYNGYETMVALPLNKELKDSQEITSKIMIPGFILEVEVTGGPAKVQSCFLQLNNYVSDYKKVSPAIPFESLVTNRELEADTSKWITRLYYPVFY